MLSNYDKYQIKYFDAIEAEAASMWCSLHNPSSITIAESKY